MPEGYVEKVALAKKEIELADHLLRVTYPLVKETKFLLSISNHVVKASKLALNSLFEYAIHWKLMAPIPLGNFAVEISMFRNKLADMYKFDLRFVRLLRKLDEVDKFDKESIIRFKRGEKYILASGDYRAITSIDVNSVKSYVNVTKQFVDRIEEIIGKIP